MKALPIVVAVSLLAAFSASAFAETKHAVTNKPAAPTKSSYVVKLEKDAFRVVVRVASTTPQGIICMVLESEAAMLRQAGEGDSVEKFRTIYIDSPTFSKLLDEDKVTCWVYLDGVYEYKKPTGDTGRMPKYTWVPDSPMMERIAAERMTAWEKREAEERKVSDDKIAEEMKASEVRAKAYVDDTLRRQVNGK